MRAEDYEAWKNKAVGVVVKAEKMLWGKNNEEIQTRMYQLGFTLHTMRTAKLGWQVRNTKRSASGWGISHCEHVMLPEGITIPIIHDGLLKKVVIWRMGHDHDGEIHVVEGSANIPLVLPGETPDRILVKSEMDALLLHQELQEKLEVVAVGDLTPDEVAPHVDSDKRNTLLAIGGAMDTWRDQAESCLTIDAKSLPSLAETGELEKELAKLTF